MEHTSSNTKILAKNSEWYKKQMWDLDLKLINVSSEVIDKIRDLLDDYNISGKQIKFEQRRTSR